MKIASNLWTVLLFLSILTAGCQSQSEADQMAADLCECMRPMTESLKAIETLSAAGEVDALEEAMESLDATARETEQCTDALEEKYGDALEQQEEKIKELMVEKCPEVARAMQEAEAIF